MIFWINVPVGLVAALWAHKALARLPRHDRKHKLDLLGAGLMMASAIPLLLASRGATRYPLAVAADCRTGRGGRRAVDALCLAVTQASEPVPAAAVLANPIMRMAPSHLVLAGGGDTGSHFPAAYYEVVHASPPRCRAWRSSPSS